MFAPTMKQKAMTKNQLLAKNIELEEELHISNNSADYWNHEYNELLKRYEALCKKVSDDEVYGFLADCSIVQKAQLSEFIKTII